VAQDFIAIDRTHNQGAKLLNAIATLQSVSNDLELLKDIMDHNVLPDGTDPADYAGTATLFGIDQTVATNAQTVYNALATTVAQLAHADVKTLMTRVGH